MFFMIRPFLGPFLHARPGSSNCRVCSLHPIPLLVEIIGTVFRTGFQIQAVPHYPPMLTLATSDVLASPHSHHFITLRNSPGPMIGPSHSIGCRLSEILSDPARPTSVHHHCRELPIFLSSNVSAVTAFGTTSFPPRPYKQRAECYRDSTTSHIPSPGINSIFCSFTTLPSNLPRISVSARKKLTTATHHPLGRSHSCRPLALHRLALTAEVLRSAPS